MKKANKGEWSELYCALRILSEKRLYIANSKGKKDPNKWMTVLELIRQETKARIVRYRCSETTTDITISMEKGTAFTLPVTDFLSMADDLLDTIKKGKSVFSISVALENQLKNAGFTSIKAAGNKKSDIFLTIKDPRSGIERSNIGFSIKSELGEASTLFNTAKASALIYRLPGMTVPLMNKINSIFTLVKGENKIAASTRFSEILRNGITPESMGFEYAKKAKCRAFEENLDLLNPRLRDYLDVTVRRMFDNRLGSTDLSVKAITDYVVQVNPCKLPFQAKEKYEYMIKLFLYASYCKMTASTIWDGKGEVNGGYICISKEGVVLAFYALESDTFKQHLFENCFFDKPATDNKHGNYGSVYQNTDGDFFFKLNFQVHYSLKN